jgi:flagellar hook-associated protein 3 FlgL
MRISSAQYFNMNVQSMGDQQSALAAMYAQISSGKRIQTASDDPLGAAQAVQLTAQGATLAQYGTNQAAALTSLQTEDSTLSSVVGTMQSIQALVTHAGDGSLSDSDRAAVGTEIAGYRAQLLTLANTTDAQGNYIFAGFKSGAAPFSSNVSGIGATYVGDYGQSSAQVADGRTIQTADTGASIFQSVVPGESTPVASATPGNSGTGTFGAVSVTNASNAGNALGYTISFAISSTDGSTSYSVVDSNNNQVATSVPYTAGTPISLGGESLTISGAPGNNDSFSVQPANNSGNTDIFATLDNLVNALKQPSGAAASGATLTNALATAGAQIGNTYNNMLAAQTAVGGREQEVTATQTAMTTTSTQTASNLADLTSLNTVSAISQYELTQNSLQAAQLAFSQVQKLSLFNYLN